MDDGDTTVVSTDSILEGGRRSSEVSRKSCHSPAGTASAVGGAYLPLLREGCDGVHDSLENRFGARSSRENRNRFGVRRSHKNRFSVQRPRETRYAARGSLENRRRSGGRSTRTKPSSGLARNYGGDRNAGRLSQGKSHCLGAREAGRDKMERKKDLMCLQEVVGPGQASGGYADAQVFVIGSGSSRFGVSRCVHIYIYIPSVP